MNTSNNHPDYSSHPMSQAPEVALSRLLQEVGTANPEELLGAGAHTSLAAAMVQATVLTALLMVGLTFGPYLWSMTSPAAASKATPTTPEETAKAAPTAPATPATPATSDKGKTTPEAPKPALAAKDAPVVSKEAVDKLGVNDTKKTDPTVNPLDKSTDDLFKELDKK